MNLPFGWFSTGEWAHFVKAEININAGCIEYRRCSTIYNTSDSNDMDHKVNTLITLIKRVAGILAIKENSIDGYLDIMKDTRDNPQKRVKNCVLSLGEQEGVFCLEENAIPALCQDGFGQEVLKRAWADIKSGSVPYSIKGTR